MTYFPSGFWSRLMTRLLGDDFVIEIIRSFYTIPKDITKDMLSSAMIDSKAEWICWQTGLALKYFGDIIFRVKEILPNVSPAAKAIDYLQPSACKFLVNQEGSWSDIELHKSSILEIHIPNHCVKIDMTDMNSSLITPNPEYVTKLLSLTVDHIDTLLEDWYPSLGTRFVHTSQGKFFWSHGSFPVSTACIRCRSRCSPRPGHRRPALTFNSIPGHRPETGKMSSCSRIVDSAPIIRDQRAAPDQETRATSQPRPAGNHPAMFRIHWIPAVGRSQMKMRRRPSPAQFTAS